MRKEILFAIIGGSIFGLVIAFGIWRVNSALSPRNQAATDTQEEPKKDNAIISVAEPSENDVLGASPTSISGLTRPASLVVISGEDHDYLVVADNKGAFSEDISLVGGINQLVATAFDKDGTSGEQKLTVIYSTEFAKPTQAPTEVAESTDSIRQKVQEKVEDALNSPTAYLGTVTDISEGSIQLKSASGEINQVSSSDTPTVVKDGKSPKTVKLTDIAIGDFIVAMGYRNGNHVLTAKRILITTPPDPTGRKAVYGNVASVTKTGLTLETKQGDITITVGTTTIIYQVKGEAFTKIKLASLEEGNLVAAAFEASDKNNARTVFLIAAE
jgi:hypothetical protein